MLPINAPIYDQKEEIAAEEVITKGLMTDASFNGGKYVREFEETIRGFVGATDAVAVNSGTAALHIALLAVGVGPGDEVILPSMTFIASANAVRAVGAKPIFADIDEYYTLDGNDIERKISSRTKAIMPVHLYGHTADMASITKIAQEHELYVIEDAAQSLGSLYGSKMTGTIGHIGCYSFYASKVMTTGEGGALVSNDLELTRRARSLRNHGYDQDNSLSGFGLNYRLNQVSAAIGTVQIKKLDGFLRIRAKNAALLQKLIKKPEVVPMIRDGSKYNWYLYTIRTNRRNEIHEALRRNGIDSRVYYDPPVHKTPLYNGQAVLPRTEKYASLVISLPVNPLLQPSDIETIAGVVNDLA